ncbi:MAG: DUF4430 domain-containing protein [Oscillospiraceae bacterium]|nr:DUF4430 domain-containing protein [Oscillospiraceae bacterium]
MKKKLLFAGVLALLMALFAGLYVFTRPGPVTGDKTICVQVVQKDQSRHDYTYQTQEEYLAPVLTQSGLVKGEQGPYGFYIMEVEGQRADYTLDGAYWALYIGEDYATSGADTTPIHDGDLFRLVYTLA